MRMIQRRCQLRLLLESSARCRIRQLVRQKLDRHRAIQLGVERAVYRPHTARAELRLDPIRIYKRACDHIRAFRRVNSPRERIGTHLNLIDLRSRRDAAFVVEDRAGARGRPQSAAFPPSAGIINASIHVLAEETHRVRNVDVYELSVDQRQKPLTAVGLRDRYVGSEPESVVAIHPDVIGVIGAAGIDDVLELRPWEWIKRPPFGTMFTRGGGWSVERALALSA